MLRTLAITYLFAAACTGDSEPLERPTDPTTCADVPGPAAGDACTRQGQACHYTGGGCGPNFVCNDGRWEETGGRFSCGDCASDVRCGAGATCSNGDDACTCGDDGVFECALTGTSTTGLPACPIEQPPATSCPADGQRCHYFSGICRTACECASGAWSCEQTCGA